MYRIANRVNDFDISFIKIESGEYLWVDEERATVWNNNNVFHIRDEIFEKLKESGIHFKKDSNQGLHIQIKKYGVWFNLDVVNMINSLDDL